MLPASWGSPEAFPALITLTLFNLAVTGTLPASWGSNGSFAALQSMGLGGDTPPIPCISGPLPPEWGSSVAFQQLQILTFRACFRGTS